MSSNALDSNILTLMWRMHAVECCASASKCLARYCMAAILNESSRARMLLTTLTKRSRARLRDASPSLAGDATGPR